MEHDFNDGAVFCGVWDYCWVLFWGCGVNDLRELKNDITNTKKTIQRAIYSLHKKWGLEVEVEALCKDGEDGKIISVNVMSGIVFSNE